jgi:hypothetical protein
MDDDVQRLLDREAIKETKARYFRYLDTKQWQLLRSLFTDDARLQATHAEWDDMDQWIHDLAEMLGPARTVHQGHMPEITFTGADTARVIWAMHDFVEFPEVVDGRRGFVGFGHYEEEYRRTSDGWKITFLRLTRLRLDPLLGVHPPTDPVPRTTTLDWLPG